MSLANIPLLKRQGLHFFVADKETNIHSAFAKQDDLIRFLKSLDPVDRDKLWVGETKLGNILSVQSAIETLDK